MIKINNDCEFTPEELEALRISGIQIQIDELKEKLNSSDYKVIKNMEAIQAGENPPYEPSELHRIRQELRDKINELEGQI